MQSPRGLQVLASLTLAAVLGVILWGAYVRATGAGAGCGAHWPACNGQVVPSAPSARTLIEYVHRLTSGLALLLVAATFALAARAHPRGHTVRRAAFASLLLMLIEAGLGAGLVLLELVALDASVRRAVAMSLHLTNTFFLLAALGTCAFHAWVGPASQRRALTPAVPWAAAGFVLVGISGAVAALGDTLLQLGARSAFVEALIGLRVAHPVLAGAQALLLLAAGAQLWSAQKAARPALVVLGALFGLQLGSGALNVALKAPVWLQLAHLGVADCVWLSLVVVWRLSRGASSGERDAAGAPAMRWA